jgi:hypothetical protein
LTPYRGTAYRLVLAAALTVLPLQGVAATLSVLLCHGDAQMHTAHGHGNDAGASDHDQHAGDQHEGGNAPANSTNYHPCCHYTASAPADLTPQALSADFPVLTPARDTLHDLFVPERPQRPPLA